MVSDELFAEDDWAGGRPDTGLGAGGDFAGVAVAVAGGVKRIGVGHGVGAACSNEI